MRLLSVMAAKAVPMPNSRIAAVLRMWSRRSELAGCALQTTAGCGPLKEGRIIDAVPVTAVNSPTVNTGAPVNGGERERFAVQFPEGPQLLRLSGNEFASDFQYANPPVVKSA